MVRLFIFQDWQYVHVLQRERHHLDYCLRGAVVRHDPSGVQLSSLCQPSHPQGGRFFGSPGGRGDPRSYRPHVPVVLLGFRASSGLQVFQTFR